jgi:hypothetical protein
MHMFNRGFNGKQVGISAGPKMGPVSLQVAGPTPIAVPAMTGSFGAPAAPKAIQGPAPVQVQAPAAPATPPGAIPMGKKANCPVCRTFGG